ncbi:hypothetical protein [Wenyingzhuangia sp. 2_MG-2023]|uniref:hypothetical protein n=1 Tax=Wenyingzhuangia sp. 2_MG-2023 TaxID=3062639 RepID=UPI0026E24A39|nr:hypothetical protein [Wenyingzhuangia sp. 2_MG-2023]MDO6739377.1 hypothetical protein [Wenyingzhuangia sp. 2_MG-2023]
MKNPVKLHEFNNSMDACHLKNSIEIVSNISVEIIRNTNKNDIISHQIFVDKSNYPKALILLHKELSILEYSKRRAAEKKLILESNQEYENSKKSTFFGFFRKKIQIYQL